MTRFQCLSVKDIVQMKSVFKELKNQILTGKRFFNSE